MKENEQTQVPLWTRQFLLITIINLFLYFAFQLVTPTISVYVKSLGAADNVIGWLNGIFTLAALIARPLAGSSLDRLGRRGIFLAGMAVFIAAATSYAWVPTIVLILILRFIHGIGWGASSTALYTIASDNIPNQRYGEGMGFFTLASNIAMAAAPATGLALIAAYGYKAVSVLSGSLAIVALLFSLRVKYKEIPGTQDMHGKRVLFEKTSFRPASVMFFLTITYGSLNTFLALYAMERGIGQFGLFFTVMALSMMIARPLFGRIVDRYGVSVAVVPGMAGMALSIFLLSRATTLTMFLVVAFLYGMGFGAAQSSLQTLAVIHAPRSNLGIANSTFFFGFDSGIGAGAVILGTLAAKVGYSQMFQWSIVSVALAFVLYFVTGRKEQRK